MSKKRSRLTGDVDTEFVLNASFGGIFFTSIDTTTIGTLIFLFEGLDTKDGLIVVTIGIDTISGIARQVFEALEELD